MVSRFTSGAKNPYEASMAVDLYTRLHSILLEVWSCVHDLLCNDAPEGYMPEDMEDEASVTTKDVLSYAWRSLKESR